MADVHPARADGRRLGESLSAGFSMSDLLAQRRLGETVRDAERRLIAEARPIAYPGDGSCGCSYLTGWHEPECRYGPKVEDCDRGTLSAGRTPDPGSQPPH